MNASSCFLSKLVGAFMAVWACEITSAVLYVICGGLG